MAAYRDHHGTIFLPPEIAGPIEAVRRVWDPVMTDQIAAHVTLVYPAHVTLVHPRTSSRGPELWSSGTYQPQFQEFTVREVAVAAFDGIRWVTLATCRGVLTDS